MANFFNKPWITIGIKYLGHKSDPLPEHNLLIYSTKSQQILFRQALQGPARKTKVVSLAARNGRQAKNFAFSLLLYT